MAIKKPSENTMICSTIIEYLASTVVSKHAGQSRPHWRRSQSPRSGRSELVFPWPTTFSGRLGFASTGYSRRRGCRSFTTTCRRCTAIKLPNPPLRKASGASGPTATPLKSEINAFNSRCDHEHPRLPRASVFRIPTVRQSLDRNTIYTFGKKYTRWGGGFPGKFVPGLKIEGKCSHLRAKAAHFPGHLP
jgi:hypothetical protein